MKNEKVLITGGSGLVGTRLTELLTLKGYKVSHLGRKEDFNTNIARFKWDPGSQFLDINSLKTDHIIHLAGAGVADKRWSNERKLEISKSRIEGSRLIFESLKNNQNSVKTIVAASAIGYYGFDNNILVSEYDKPGNDFLANVTVDWENEVDKIATLDKRVVKMRIGVVLAKNGGALPQMAMPIKYFAGAALGSGTQMVSWIDLDDLCNMFIFAIENSTMKGAYNAVAPNPVTNEVITHSLAKILNRPIWPINIPVFFLKIVLGEMGNMILGSCNVHNKRIAEETNFIYKYPNLVDSLNHQLN